MRVFMTGATGFIGGEAARRLRARGDDVRALVRNPAKAGPLEAEGCEIAEGDVTDFEAVRAGLEGCDAAIHAAAIYEVGIKKSEREPMYEANVRGTETVLGAALESRTPKVVYVSTVAAIGNTEGEIADENWVHRERYCNYYEETKHLAHKATRRLIDEEGLPAVIVQPGGVYGPNDHSQIGNVLNQFLAGRMPLMVFPEAGFNFVHRDDVADGIILALDKGNPGEQYILGGQLGTLRDLIETAARVAGKKPPRRNLPTGLMKASAPLGPVIGPLMGFPPNLKELIATSDGVTYWAKDDKARSELGYSARPLEQGLRDTLAVEGKLPAAA
jgi:nucleoside-diphosphate-sugar epimerase